MARDYWFSFGSQPSQTASLAPTFITFINGSGTTYAGPTITETYAGSGLYKVNYGATQTIAFVMDGATTGLDSSIRYIFGVFDPSDEMLTTLQSTGSTLSAIGMSNIALGTTNVALGTTNIALGTTNIALGTTAVASINNAGATLVAIGSSLSAINLSVAGIGSTGSTFGGVSTNPETIFGYLRRVVEFLEGNQTYTKASGALAFTSKGGSYALVNKTVSDSTTQTTKT